MIKPENRYSIWLRPKQTQIDELTKIISKLSHRYRCIAFAPHITLASDISAPFDSIKDACEQIIEQHQAFNITLNEISYTQKYFMHLYILADFNNALKNLHNETKVKLNLNITEAYTPHISLMYAKPNATRQQALKEELTDAIPSVFNCERIDIYNSTGNENEWYLEEAFPLKH